MQTLSNELGGEVINSDIHEFGHAEISLKNNSPIFKNIHSKNNVLDVWMSHGDKVNVLPKNFEVIASSKDCQIAGFQSSDKKIFGLQFHPEVTSNTIKRWHDIVKIKYPYIDNLNKIMKDFKKHQFKNYDWFQSFLLKLLK